MSEVKCQSSDCDRRATLHFTRAEDRRAVEVIHFCDLHSRTHFRERYEAHCSPSRIGRGCPMAMGNGVAFDIDFLLFDQSLEPWPWGRCYVGLLEVGGNRRLGFEIGLSECTELDRRLQGYTSPRPLTHDAMGAAITALGGRLQYVEIDRFVAAQQCYEAKLHIAHLNRTIAVDVRPSDSLVLSLVCSVPIIVSNDVLRALEAET